MKGAAAFSVLPGVTALGELCSEDTQAALEKPTVGSEVFPATDIVGEEAMCVIPVGTQISGFGLVHTGVEMGMGTHRYI